MKKNAPGPVCDCCGEAIEAGEDYYELPDGWLACAGGDCLEDWAAPYRRRYDEEDDA